MPCCGQGEEATLADPTVLGGARKRPGGRTSPKEWVENGRPDLLKKAIAEKRRILDAPPARHIDTATDAAIRARFNIHLPR